MRQTKNISLSGIAFSVELEGYDKLKSYLESIENEYPDATDAQELLSDIEARITELILNKQSSAAPVTVETIDGIIKQMGFPSKYDEDEVFSKTERRYQTPPTYTTKQVIMHRLYRNPNGAVIGGVCSGIASYFKIDPVVVRLLFMLYPMFSVAFIMVQFVRDYSLVNFSLVIIYLALWIVVPKAKTARQMLEMEGSQITKERIETFIKEEMTDMEMNIGRVARSQKSATLFSSIVYILGYIFKILLYIIGIGVIVGICGGMVFATIGLMRLVIVDYADILVGGVAFNTVAAVIIATIPFIMILLGVVHLIFKLKIKSVILYVLLAIWLSAMIYGTVITAKSVNILT